jgi:hypothetical protein
LIDLNLIGLDRVPASKVRRLKIEPRGALTKSILLIFFISFFLSFNCAGYDEFLAWDPNTSDWVKNNIGGYKAGDCLPTYQLLRNDGRNALTEDVQIVIDYVVDDYWGTPNLYYCGDYNPHDPNYVPPIPTCTLRLEDHYTQSLNPNSWVQGPLTYPMPKPTGTVELTYLWHIKDLAPGATAVIYFCTKLSNEVIYIPGSKLHIWSSDGGAISLPCGGSVAAPDMSIGKSHTSTCGKIAYTLTYRNHDTVNPIPQTGTIITDDYEETKVTLDESSISSNPPGVSHTVSDGRIVWSIPGSVAAGSSGTVTYTMNLLPNVFPASVANTAVISGTNVDRNSADNSVTVLSNDIKPNPYIATQPATQTVCAGATEATLNVAASGPSLTYQWYHGTETLSDSAHIAGSDTATLHIYNVVVTDEGDYYVRITSNPSGCYVDSNNAHLTVEGAPIANAGINEDMCVLDTLPLYGSGTGFDPSTAAWSVVSGLGGTFTYPNSPNDMTYAIFSPNSVNGVGETSTLRFTVTGNAPCSSITVYDEMDVMVYSKAAIELLLKSPTDA